MSRSKKKKVDATENDELDMTPMIDIVFNLLIFFMVITDLTQKDLVELTLPIAYMALSDVDDDPDDRLILNVDKFGQIKWKGQFRTLGELSAILAQQKQLYQVRKAREGESAFEEFPGGKATKLFVLLRADKDTPWQHVQWLMTVMAQQKYYKLQFAASKFIGGDQGWEDGEQEYLGGISTDEYEAIQKAGAE